MATLVIYEGKEICFMNEDAFKAFKKLQADNERKNTALTKAIKALKTEGYMITEEFLDGLEQALQDK